jgi:3-methyladenine DNA glycosylase AlkC
VTTPRARKAFTLKSFFSPAIVRRLATAIVRVHPTFPEGAFVKDACAGLQRHEFLARGKHIAAALARHLPPAYPDAIHVLIRSLGTELPPDEIIGIGMGPFFYLPHVTFVAERGLDDFDLSMRAQYELTKRFTAESSIRAYIARDPERTFAFLHLWARDENAHVRRLVSEGTRLRLPWAARVPWLDANPERVLELLELLRDDPSPMVRRSVANNLNDLGKVRPDLLVRTCGAWLAGATDGRRALVEHALRSAVKRGEREALELLGYGKKASVRVEAVRFEPRRVRIGGRVAMSFALRSQSPDPQDLLIDVAVHFVKGRGGARPKVFKVKRAALAPRGRIELQTSFSLAVHTTRVPRRGTHAVDVLVNGQPFRAGTFEVVTSR